MTRTPRHSRPSRLLAAGTAIALTASLLSGCLGVEIPIGPAPVGTEEPAEPTTPDELSVGQVEQWSDAFEMTVVEIVDGDTLRAQLESTNDVVTTTWPIAIRLIGLDTPETYPDEECFGPEAAAVLGYLAPVGSTVYVAPDVDSWDDYNRRLFYAWTHTGVFINGTLAVGGYADVRSYPPNTTLQEVLQTAEDAAKDANRGLWGSCD